RQGFHGTLRGEGKAGDYAFLFHSRPVATGGPALFAWGAGSGAHVKYRYRTPFRGIRFKVGKPGCPSGGKKCLQGSHSPRVASLIAPACAARPGLLTSP